MSTKRITAYYSLNQVGFWMVFCLSSSFAAVYLGALGYSNTKLGSMLALGSVLGFLLGTGLSSFVDTSPRFNAADVLWPVLALQAAFFLLLLFFPARGVVTTLCYPLLLAFTLAVNTLNLKLCADFDHYESPVNYGIARSMGSAAYMVLSMLLGVWVTRFGVRVIPIAGLAVTALQGVSNALLSRSVLRLRRKLLSGHAAPAPQGRSLGVFLRENPRFCLLLAGMALLFFSHNTTSTFLINFVEHAGGGTETLGYLTAFLTALEVPTMLFFSRIFRRRSCAAVLRFSFIFFALKTAAIAAAPNIPLLFAAEALQALSYALYAPAIVAYVTLIVPYDDAAKGQSLAFSMTTMGGVLASLISGRLLDVLSAPATAWIAAAVCAASARAPARPLRAELCRICAPSRSRYSCRRAGASSGITSTMGCPAVRLASVRAVAKGPEAASMVGCPGASCFFSMARASIPSARPSRAVPVGPLKSRYAYRCPFSPQAAA